MTSQIQVNLNPQSISQQTHPEVAGQLWGTVKRQRSGCFPNGWDDPPTYLHMNSPSWHNHTTSMAKALALCNGPQPEECASLWILTNPPLTDLCVSNWIFAMRHQSLSCIRSWSQPSWVLAMECGLVGFWIHMLGECGNHPNHWGTVHSSVFWQCLGTVLPPLGVSFSLQIWD